MQLITKAGLHWIGPIIVGIKIWWNCSLGMVEKLEHHGPVRLLENGFKIQMVVIHFCLGPNTFVFYRNVRRLACRCFWTRHRSPHFSSKRFGTAACIWEAPALYQSPLPPAVAFFARSALTPSWTIFLYLVFCFFHCRHSNLRRRRRFSKRISQDTSA